MIAAFAAVLLAAAPSLIAPGVVSTEKNEYNLTASADGATVVFARSEPEFRNAKVFAFDGSAASPLPFSDPAHTDSDPQIAPDGRSLLFVSDRPLPERPQGRDLNVWRVRRDADGWGVPEPVPGVNSPGYELGPELHGGALYFNSTRAGGPGRLDIWRAAQTAEGFAAPQVLPSPINSSASEGDFTLSPDGKTAVFWSDRPGGSGQGDLWVSVREGEGWREPVNLGPEVNSPGFDFTPSFSPDGRVLVFASDRGGPGRLADVYAVAVEDVPALKAALER